MELSPTVDVSKGSIVSMITTVTGDAVTILSGLLSVTVTGVSVSVTVRPDCVTVTFAVFVAWIVMIVSDSSSVDDVVFAADEVTSVSIGGTDRAVLFEDMLWESVDEAVATPVEYGVV